MPASENTILEGGDRRPPFLKHLIVYYFFFFPLAFQRLIQHTKQAIMAFHLFLLLLAGSKHPSSRNRIQRSWESFRSRTIDWKKFFAVF